MASLTTYFRTWRRKFKASFPYVRRREYRILQRNHSELIEALDRYTTPASTARIYLAKPPLHGLTGEVCLFVSFASQPSLKPHATAHINHLLDAGIHVLLIINTDLPASTIAIERPLQDRLSGILIRENIGFDFGAWAHALFLCQGYERWTRLYLVNDSIFGPLSEPSFRGMIKRVRSSTADVVGLTESLAPRRHLQSYFMVFNVGALCNHELIAFFGRILNWPTKSQVIEVYEARLTALLEAAGLRCESLFPSLWNDPLSSDDTSIRWSELVAAGFPYVKTRVLEKHAKDKRIKTWLATRIDLTHSD